MNTAHCHIFTPSAENLKKVFATSGCEELIRLDRRNSGCAHDQMPKQGFSEDGDFFVPLFDSVHGYYRRLVDYIVGIKSDTYLGILK